MIFPSSSMLDKEADKAKNGQGIEELAITL